MIKKILVYGTLALAGAAGVYYGCDGYTSSCGPYFKAADCNPFLEQCGPF